MKTVLRFFVFLAIGFASGSLDRTSNAQDDFDRMFEQMIEEFFPNDLLKEIEKIREKEEPENKSSFYKNDPRFLAIKERQVRNRRKDPAEKQHPSTLRPFQPLSQKLSASVVALFDGETDKRLALATAVTEHLLVTKASELKSLKELKCVSNDSRKFTAKVVKIEKIHDLALLQTAEPLEPIAFTRPAMEEGTLLVTVNNTSQPVALGTLAVKPRSIIGKNRGFLGVEPGPAAEGVLIKSVNENTAASRAKIQPGDVVTSINGVPTRSVAELVREIGSKKKGDTITLKIVRDQTKTSVQATLDGRMIRGERAARFEMMRRLGAVLSSRHDEFPSVIEHDTPILPNDCGSPIVDLDGNVVGLNIARAGRTSSYAIPIQLVQDLVRSFKP
ncbi:MAG: PDZ domain-containing protein [Planctomycetota bacterium]|nr:PDZ domain-containing protein [Planctomycetota bacterium]